MNFVLTCLLALYYLFFLIRIMAASCTTTSLSKKDPFLSLYCDFQPAQNVKCYRLVYLPLLIARNTLLQLAIVAASESPFIQAAVSAGVEAIFLLYTFLCNPFEFPYSICVYLTEILLACQLTIMTVMCYMPESDRLRYALIMLALNYSQMAVFGIFCLAGAFRYVHQLIRDCRNRNKVIPEVISENSQHSDIDVKEKELCSEINESKYELREEDVPSIADIQEQLKIKKRYRVQKKNQVYPQS